jgi:hypothetical protein
LWHVSPATTPALIAGWFELEALAGGYARAVLRSANTYSRRWHETLHRDYDPEVTKQETAFLAEWLPAGRVLDFELFTPAELRTAVELPCIFERSSPN